MKVQYVYVQVCKKTILLWNDCGIEGQDNYRSFLSSFCTRVVFLHIFISALFLYFLQVHPYLSFAETFLPTTLHVCTSGHFEPASSLLKVVQDT